MPWNTSENAGYELHGQGAIADEVDGKTIAIVFDLNKHGNLIAAAPELLEALKSLVGSPIRPLDGYEKEIDRHMIHAHTAIAKAEGRE